jgi:hypothetical protein
MGRQIAWVAARGVGGTDGVSTTDPLQRLAIQDQLAGAFLQLSLHLPVLSFY